MVSLHRHRQSYLGCTCPGECPSVMRQNRVQLQLKPDSSWDLMVVTDFLSAVSPAVRQTNQEVFVQRSSCLCLNPHQWCRSESHTHFQHFKLTSKWSTATDTLLFILLKVSEAVYNCTTTPDVNALPHSGLFCRRDLDLNESSRLNEGYIYVFTYDAYLSHLKCLEACAYVRNHHVSVRLYVNYLYSHLWPVNHKVTADCLTF